MIKSHQDSIFQKLKLLHRSKRKTHNMLLLSCWNRFKPGIWVTTGMPVRGRRQKDTMSKMVFKSFPSERKAIQNVCERVSQMKSYRGEIQNLNRSRGEFHTDCRFGFQAELVPCKSGKQIRLPHSRISDQDYFEKIVVLIICFVMSHSVSCSSLSYQTTLEVADLT
jgi:hypothetical protein